MKIELFDAYSIRARLSVTIILLSPVILSLFLCFQSAFTTLSSAVIIMVLLAFANYLPVIQRSVGKKKYTTPDYAAQYLLPTDNTLDSATKERYYKKLAVLDASFSGLSDTNNPDLSEKIASAVLFLREKTRDCRLVLEENITYGFCKNLQSAKPFGIAMCILTDTLLIIYAAIKCSSLSDISLRLWFALAVNFGILLFWVGFVKETNRDAAAKRYAKALISAIDSL